MKKYVNLSIFYLIIGLALGVFYREYTKLNNFNGITILSAVHTHTLILGFIFFMIVLLLEKNFKISSVKSFGKWLIVYNFSLIYLLSTLVIRGILEVKGINFVGLPHIAGLGHALMGISLIWFIIILKKSTIE
ncbi:MAG: DUF2871 domain-containing protein [Sarcina sp.]